MECLAETERRIKSRDFEGDIGAHWIVGVVTFCFETMLEKITKLFVE